MKQNRKDVIASLCKARARYKSCIRWYMELVRYKQHLYQSEDWNDINKKMKDDVDFALRDAGLNILSARKTIESLELELIKIKSTKKVEDNE